MTEKPTVKSPEAQSPPHGPERNSPTVTTPRQSRWKKILREKILRKKVLVPVVMFGLGAVLLLVGLWIYPQRADATPAATDQLQITGDSWVNSHMVGIYYTVQQVHPDIARVTVTVGLLGARIPRSARVVIQLTQPHGLTVLRCFPRCGHGGATAAAVAHFGHPGQPSAYFVVKARSFEVAANGANAAVSFPEVSFAGTHQVTMDLVYEGGIPTANSYDWSSYPATMISKSTVSWTEPVAPGPGQTTNGRVVSGVNHAAQTLDGKLILAAGILFGLGGGALVAAVQEALHG